MALLDIIDNGTPDGGTPTHQRTLFILILTVYTFIVGFGLPHDESAGCFDAV